MKKKPSFVRVYKGIQIPWLLVVASLICAIISSYVELNSVTLTAQIIDSSQGVKREKLVSYVLFILESGALGVISTFLSSYVSQKLNLGVRSKLWNKMLRIPVRYYDGESGESLVSRVTTDCDKASSYISYFISLITAIYAAVIAVIRMFKIDPVLSKYALLIIPFSTIIGYFLGKLFY
jgi:ATP-binding cassette subfamily B protein AbcA/BmrA